MTTMFVVNMENGSRLRFLTTDGASTVLKLKDNVVLLHGKSIDF